MRHHLFCRSHSYTRHFFSHSLCTTFDTALLPLTHVLCEVQISFRGSITIVHGWSTTGFNVYGDARPTVVRKFPTELIETWFCSDKAAYAREADPATCHVDFV